MLVCTQAYQPALVILKGYGIKIANINSLAGRIILEVRRLLKLGTTMYWCKFRQKSGDEACIQANHSLQGIFYT